MSIRKQFILATYNILTYSHDADGSRFVASTIFTNSLRDDG